MAVLNRQRVNWTAPASQRTPLTGLATPRWSIRGQSKNSGSEGEVWPTPIPIAKLVLSKSCVFMGAPANGFSFSAAKMSSLVASLKGFRVSSGSLSRGTLTR